MEVLHTLHMDLCGPMRLQSINGKRYILVIVDDYSRYTLVKFFRSKDETPEFVIKFLKQKQVDLDKTVRYIRTDNNTEFVNQVLTEFYKIFGISHQKSVLRTPQQNGIKLLLLLDRSLIHTHHNKTPYEIMHCKKSDLIILCIFGALCYPTNDSKDLEKLIAKADIGIFIGYAPIQVPVVSTGVAVGPTLEDNPFSQADNDPFVNPFTPEHSSEESSLGDVSTTEYNQVIQPHDHLGKWTKDHSMDNVIDGCQDFISEWRAKRRSLRQSTRGILISRSSYTRLSPKKALYSLKQAPRVWYDTLSRFLLENKFSKGVVDLTDEFKILDVNDGTNVVFLGLQVSQSPGGIVINQSKYALEILKKYGMDSCEPVDTPMMD
ncbi:retrovirus-related pol polyprotein from transposon TNT 1-94 [Tanacetum coccineum]